MDLFNIIGRDVVVKIFEYLDGVDKIVFTRLSKNIRKMLFQDKQISLNHYGKTSKEPVKESFSMNKYFIDNRIISFVESYYSLSLEHTSNGIIKNKTWKVYTPNLEISFTLKFGTGFVKTKYEDKYVGVIFKNAPSDKVSDFNYLNFMISLRDHFDIKTRYKLMKENMNYSSMNQKIDDIIVMQAVQKSLRKLQLYKTLIETKRNNLTDSLGNLAVLSDSIIYIIISMMDIKSIMNFASVNFMIRSLIKNKITFTIHDHHLNKDSIGKTHIYSINNQPFHKITVMNINNNVEKVVKKVYINDVLEHEMNIGYVVTRSRHQTYVIKDGKSFLKYFDIFTGDFTDKYHVYHYDNRIITGEKIDKFCKTMYNEHMLHKFIMTNCHGSYKIHE